MRVALLSVVLVFVSAAPAAADSLVYVKDSNVWAAGPDGTGAVRITVDGSAQDRYGYPSQADDGTVLAVRGTRFYRYDRSGHRLASFGSVLTGRPAAIGAVGPFDARMSPDGSKVAYWLGIMGGWYDYARGIYYSDPESAVVYQSAIDGAQLGDTVFWEEPSWLADSQHLLVWERLNSLTPQVASGEIGADHNHFTGWFRDRETFADPVGGHEIGAGELSRDGQRLAALRSGGTSGLHSPYNQVIVYTVAGFDRAPAPMACAFEGDGGHEMGAPTFSPDGTRVAWAESSGIWVGTIGRPDSCDGWDAKLVVPGGLEPDWGPAEPGPGAAPVGGTPPAGGTAAGGTAAGGTVSAGTATGGTGASGGTTSVAAGGSGAMAGSNAAGVAAQADGTGTAGQAGSAASAPGASDGSAVAHTGAGTSHGASPGDDVNGNSEISVTSSPSGARVFVDNVDTGKITPTKLEIPKKSDKPISITLRLKGYEPFTFKAVDVRESSQQVADLVKTRAAGSGAPAAKCRTAERAGCPRDSKGCCVPAGGRNASDDPDGLLRPDSP